MHEKVRPRLRFLLDRKEIRRSTSTMQIIAKELDGAMYDLEAASVSLNNGGYKWATIQASHSMLHAARALLNRMGYREQSHYGLREALHQLYEKEVIERMVVDLSKTMTLTDQLHDGRFSSEDSAKATFESATDFIEQAARILSAPREWFERSAPRPRTRRKRN